MVDTPPLVQSAGGVRAKGWGDVLVQLPVIGVPVVAIMTSKPHHPPSLVTTGVFVAASLLYLGMGTRQVLKDRPKAALRLPGELSHPPAMFPNRIYVVRFRRPIGPMAPLLRFTGALERRVKKGEAVERVELGDLPIEVADGQATGEIELKTPGLKKGESALDFEWRFEVALVGTDGKVLDTCVYPIPVQA